MKPTDLIKLVALHIGRRGAFLLFLSMIFLVGGFNFLDRNASQLENIYPLLKAIPVEVWGWGWLVTGAVCAVGALLEGVEWASFALASFLMLSWSANYIWAWSGHTIPRPWTGLVIYGSFSLMITLVSGWRENKRGVRKFIRPGGGSA